MENSYHKAMKVSIEPQTSQGIMPPYVLSKIDSNWYEAFFQILT